MDHPSTPFVDADLKVDNYRPNPEEGKISAPPASRKTLTSVILVLTCAFALLINVRLASPSSLIADTGRTIDREQYFCFHRTTDDRAGAGYRGSATAVAGLGVPPELGKPLLRLTCFTALTRMCSSCIFLGVSSAYVRPTCGLAWPKKNVCARVIFLGCLYIGLRFCKK